MPASRSANVEPSYTQIVLDALIAADDFVSMDSLVAMTGLTTKNLRTALPYLRDVRAIDSVDSAGRLYWFATPENDQRQRPIAERRREDEPRVAKRSRAKKLPG